MLLTLFVDTFETRAVRECLDSIAILLVVLPGAFVPAALNVDVGAATVRLVVLPFAGVGILVYVIECSEALRKAHEPQTFILSAIRPNHRSFAVAESALPLSSVDSTRFIGVDPRGRALSSEVGLARECLPVLLVLKVLLSALEFRLFCCVLPSLH